MATDTEFLDAQDEVYGWKQKYARSELTLATLCNMILGEDAEDRSDEALTRQVARMTNKMVGASAYLEGLSYYFKIHGDAARSLGCDIESKNLREYMR